MNRPSITSFKTPGEFVAAMIGFRKRNEPGFSVHKAVRGLRRISPTLVSLVVRGQRKLSLDRVEEFARLLNLNASEKHYLRNWVGGEELMPSAEATRAPGARQRKEVSTSILSDWINVYVKDFFMIPAVQKNPKLIEAFFASMASAKRVQRSIAFLLREGHLRKTINGSIVIDTKLAVADPGVPSRKIRQFHKASLALARQALELYPATERFANTMILPLDDKRHLELRELFADFAERLKDFAAHSPDSADRLYQIVVNLSPVGGKLE